MDAIVAAAKEALGPHLQPLLPPALAAAGAAARAAAKAAGAPLTALLSAPGPAPGGITAAGGPGGAADRASVGAAPEWPRVDARSLPPPLRSFEGAVGDGAISAALEGDAKWARADGDARWAGARGSGRRFFWVGGGCAGRGGARA